MQRGRLERNFEFSPSPKAIAAADFILSTSRKIQATAMSRRGFSLREAVYGECFQFCEKLSEKLLVAGFDGTYITENHASLYREGRLRSHRVAIVRLGEDHFLAVDPTVAQMDVYDDTQDISVAFFEGNSSQVRGHLQRRYGGRWESMERSQIDKLLEQPVQIFRSNGYEPFDFTSATQPQDQNILIERALFSHLPEERLIRELQRSSAVHLLLGFPLEEIESSVFDSLLKGGIITFFDEGQGIPSGFRPGPNFSCIGVNAAELGIQ